MLSVLKMLSFFLVAEALTGLIYHRLAGENSSFSSVSLFAIFYEEGNSTFGTSWMIIFNCIITLDFEIYFFGKERFILSDDCVKIIFF